MSKGLTKEIMRDVFMLADKLQTEGPKACKDEAARVKGLIRESVALEAKATRGSKCTACGSCAVCLADGPVPDAEFLALGFLYHAI